MTRLDLVQRVYLEAGLAGAGPTSTIDQVGEAAQIVGYVDEAWLNIQQVRKWRWMWELVDITIESGESSATDSVPADRYLKDTAYIDMVDLAYVHWDEWRRAYPEITSTGQPSEWTIRPDNAFLVNSTVPSDTTISVERYTNPTVMTADDDEPVGLKGEHHMIIVWQAVMLYAGFDEADKLYKHAAMQYSKKLAVLKRECDPVELW